MSFYNGILNLTGWTGNVILPTLAGFFLAIAIIQFSRGAAYSHAMYGGFLCLMSSGLLRAFETFASQRTWNDPDLFWVASISLVDWICNVLLPLYAALQVAAGGMQLAGLTNRFQPITWMRHFAAAGLCLLVSGLLRLGEFFVTQGTGGVT
jgi:hypothetical protein